MVMTGHMTAGAAGTHLDQGEDDLQYIYTVYIPVYVCLREPVNGWRDECIMQRCMYEISL